MLAHVKLHSSMLECIKFAQVEDPQLCKMIEEVKNGKVNDFKVDVNGVL